jgi:hypothetical protein
VKFDTRAFHASLLRKYKFCYTSALYMKACVLMLLVTLNLPSLRLKWHRAARLLLHEYFQQCCAVIRCCTITLFLLRATCYMAACQKGTIVPSMSQVAAPHNRPLPTAETMSVFAKGSALASWCFSSVCSWQYVHLN